MSLPTALPFGMRDIRVYPLTGETPGTGVDLPNAQTMSFQETEAFEDLRGDDALQATHGKGPDVAWELAAGGVSFDAVAVMFGGTVSLTGVTPNQIKSYVKANTDIRPYFKVEGQALSDSGGDFHIVLYRCRATGELAGKLTDSAFWLTSTKGKGLGRASDGKIWQWVNNETATGITG